MPNDHKIYQMGVKIRKSIGRKLDQMSIEYTNTFHCKTLQNLPKVGFLFEKIPSGNPDV
jgi:hypothetical protein